MYMGDLELVNINISGEVTVHNHVGCNNQLQYKAAVLRDDNPLCTAGPAANIRQTQ